MKILYVSTFPGEVYLDKVTYNLQHVGQALALRKAGHVCDIMCCADKAPSVKKIKTKDGDTVTIYCVRALKVLKNGFFLENVDKIFKQYDILQPIEYNMLYTWHMAKKYSDKVLVYHGPYYNSFNKRYNLMAKVFDIFFVRRYRHLNTPFLTKSHLAEAYLNRKGIVNTMTVGVGLNPEAMETDEHTIHPIAQRIDNFSHRFKLLYIGKLEPRRNPFFLVDVLVALRVKGIDVGLIVIGKGEESYKRDLFNQFTEVGLTDFVLYEPEIEQKYIAQVYERADIFLLPTIYDIFGMVLLEAMYFGKCVITTENGGSNMMIENGTNGIIIPQFNVIVWSEQIYDILMDENKRRNMGEKAHQTVSEFFTWDALIPKFLAAYERKLEHKDLQDGK